MERDHEKEANKLRALFQYSCDRGRIPIPEQFKHEEKGIYAFKAKSARVYCFFDGDSIIITNGAIKKQRRARREDLQKSERLRKEYQERKEEDEDVGG